MTEADKSRIENRVRHIIESQAGWAKPGALSNDMILMDSPLFMDSLDMIEMVMGLEEELEMEIPDSVAVDGFKTVQDVIDYIIKRKEEGK